MPNPINTIEVIKTQLSDVILFDKRRKTTFVIPLAELKHVINDLILIEAGYPHDSKDIS